MWFYHPAPESFPPGTFPRRLGKSHTVKQKVELKERVMDTAHGLGGVRNARILVSGHKELTIVKHISQNKKYLHF